MGFLLLLPCKIFYILLRFSTPFSDVKITLNKFLFLDTMVDEVDDYLLFNK